MAAPDGIALDWSYPFADRHQLSGFRVYRATTADMAYAAMVKELNDTAYLDRSALPGVTYYYQVKAVNNEGEGAASVSVSASRPADAEALPGAPLGLMVTTEGTSMTLIWSPPLAEDRADLLGYRVYRSLGEDDPKLLATVDGSSYVDQTTLPGRTYHYWVVAYNAIGEGEMSEPVSDSRELDPVDDPMMPQDLTVRMALGQVELSWEVPADLPLSYRIYRGTDSGDLVLIATVDGNVRTFIDMEGVEGNYYSVTAVFDDGEGPSTLTQKAEGAGYETDLPGTGGSLLTNPLFWVALVGLFAVAFVAIRLGTRKKGQ
jgi:fibronectin type 3 domain-containing protein